MLKVNFSNQAEKKLEFYEKRLVQIAKRISEKVSKICADPFLDDSKKLSGYKSLYRVKVGDYRIVYRFDDEWLHIEVIDIRSDVYGVVDRLCKKL